MFATTTRLIACQDCGHHYETIRRNTKRDSVCQLIRSMAFQAARGYDVELECVLCPKKFLPLDSSDKLCSDCTPASKRCGVGECGFCGETKPRCRVDVSVCLACAQDPKNRKRLYKALLKKQAARLATNYGPLPEQAPWPQKKTRTEWKPPEEVIAI